MWLNSYLSYLCSFKYTLPHCVDLFNWFELIIMKFWSPFRNLWLFLSFDGSLGGCVVLGCITKWYQSTLVVCSSFIFKEEWLPVCMVTYGVHYSVVSKIRFKPLASRSCCLDDYMLLRLLILAWNVTCRWWDTIRQMKFYSELTSLVKTSYC